VDAAATGTQDGASSEVALAILDTLSTLPREIGRDKLAGLLKGSQSQRVREFGYHRHANYGKLAQFTLEEVKDLIRQLIAGGYIKPVGGNLPVLRLSPQGASAVEARSAIGLNLPSKPPSAGHVCGVVESWKVEKGIQPPRPKEPGGRIGPQVQPVDDVAAFLSRPHPKPLPGPWHSGWALDFHSRFDGDEWSRGLVGGLAYRLKYEGDASAVQPLVDHIIDLIAQHPELADIEGIVPMAPSTVRPFDPVRAVADELGSRLNKKVGSVLVRVRPTAPQKEMHSMAQKRANVDGAFVVRARISGRKVLLLDDLFDSGMTLEAAFHALMDAGAARVCVLTLTRTIHSDA
jgi:adenine/guanine phosphoribosyltransferase-like PRPP-binding protein